jgi:hypothetical protein
MVLVSYATLIIEILVRRHTCPSQSIIFPINGSDITLLTPHWDVPLKLITRRE